MRTSRAWLALTLAGALVALGGAAIARNSAGPAASTSAPPVAVQFMTADSVMLSGEWFAGPAKSPGLVLGPSRRGRDADLRALAAEFQHRGFGTLVFALRDSQPADRAPDSLRYTVMTSHWVNDMVAALKAARARVDSSSWLFAWGQGLGGALALSAAAREHGVCGAVAAEDLFPSVDYAMRKNGTSVIPEAVKAQRRVLDMRDDPETSTWRLRIPIYAILIGPGAGEPGDLAEATFRHNRGPIDRWLRPGVVSPAPRPGPAQIDTLAAWFRHWTKYRR